MSETILRESVAEAPVQKSGNRWRVVVAKPGQGSSGYYSEDVFRRDAQKIIAPGGHAFIGHDDKRDVKDLIGVYEEGSFWSEEDNAVLADLTVFSHWQSFVNEVGKHVGMSLYALGEQDEEGNITSFTEDPFNGCDMVARPGLVGSGIKELLESARAHSPEIDPTVTSAVEKEKEIKMDELKAAIEALTTQVSALVTKEQAAQVEAAQAEADAEAVEARVGAYDAAVDAIEAAELPAEAAKSLRAEARKGVDVTSLIEFAKTVKTATVTETVNTREFGGNAKYESATELGKAFG